MRLKCETRGMLITRYFSWNGPISEGILFLAAISGSLSSYTTGFDSPCGFSAPTTTLNPLSMSIPLRTPSNSVRVPHYFQASRAGSSTLKVRSTSRTNSERNSEVIVWMVHDNTLYGCPMPSNRGTQVRDAYKIQR